MNVSNLFISSSEQNPTGYQLLATQTLAAPAASLNLTGIPLRRCLKVVVWINSKAGAGGQTLLTFNGDGGANYNQKYSKNGAADTDITGATSILLDDISHTFDTFCIFDITNIADSYKCGTFQTNIASSFNRMEGVLTWCNNPDRINRITITSTVNLGDKSFLQVYGAD